MKKEEDQQIENARILDNNIRLKLAENIDMSESNQSDSRSYSYSDSQN